MRMNDTLHFHSMLSWKIYKNKSVTSYVWAKQEEKSLSPLVTGISWPVCEIYIKQKNCSQVSKHMADPASYLFILNL